ncbi:MucR family transcriptional regulator [Devosia sp. RR2S18]|uniref:MucR family transcriptional regulator n=1 Tax=Devosia rhizosphaerae TaxID=3049774 RepID=UPI002541D960|nr:MucR family transcriptional regulator [Devosia sp. RR2S18]WIJ23418.1 MucR family transcriptional regulator [Devosia sp. RR2S18]
MDEQEHAPDFVALTTDVVAAYVAHNSLSPMDLPTLIADVHSALRTTHAGEPATPPVEPQRPAVPIKKSVAPEAVICLECGRKMKSLKRHLGTDHELSPDQYRAKWNLPKDYPMVAPAYAERRSELAKTHGLGRKAANAA